MKKLLVECLDCERHEVVDSFYCDGMRCKCGGGYKGLRETTLPVTINARTKRKPLLTIELENESSVPRVLYKGKEIEAKTHISFDWRTKKEERDSTGGLDMRIEHYDNEIESLHIIGRKSGEFV